jgi:hypothetical protein
MQDNKSMILLQKNGIFSVGKGSKHVHIRYFFTMDKIEKKELKLVYCPTDKMIADFSTKPLQGPKFIEFRDQMQGINRTPAIGEDPLEPVFFKHAGLMPRRCAIAQNSLKY